MKKITLLLFVMVLTHPVFETHAASDIAWHPVQLSEQTPGSQSNGDEVWGQIQVFTGRSIILESGQEYGFSKNVLIDVENLAQNIKGNVRIVLDLDGKAEFVFFHGIDMPEMFRRFGR